MIIDCFPYFNEKELLELRINLLHDYVDKFLICDANHTHRGDPKPFTCKETLKELGLISDKIEVIEVEIPSYQQNPNPWIRERMQRDAASKYITDDDIAFCGDCDEIINPEFIQYYSSIAKNNLNNILRVPMVFLNARADLRVYNGEGVPIRWDTPFFCSGSHLKKYTLSEIREASSMQTNIDYGSIFATENGKIKDAGWHFSWMGDNQRRKIKCKSFLHCFDYVPNTVASLDSDEMMDYMENYQAKDGSVDPLGRDDHILKKYDVNLLPKKIFDLLRVKEFLFQ
jgi:beta-1,4-mannosyl-glycoprotein beta-1,4-N-acetylglucosaminyltransferase